MEQLDIFNLIRPAFTLDNTKPIRLFEAFAGYGSQQMALKNLGVKVDVVGYAEIDKYAISTYEKVHGKHKNYGAIGEFDRLPKDIDICTWSFPCQDISLAGKQKGMLEDTRSNYGYVFLDTVENTPHDERPKVLLMENVKALTSEKFRKDYEKIHSRLESLGYESFSKVMNAKNYGIPQNRDRIFIVSILGGGRYSYSFPKPIKLTKRLKDYLEDTVDEKYYLSAKLLNGFTDMTDRNGFIRGKRFSPLSKKSTYANTITTSGGNRVTDNFIKETTTQCINSKVDGKQPSQQNRIYNAEGIATSITTSYNPYILIPEATKQGYAIAEEGDGVYIDRPHQKRGVVQKGMIQTIKCGSNDIGVVVKENTYLRIRKLTPREALRLMGVSDKDIDIMLDGLSDSQAYKLAGNSIVVQVLEAIFKELILKNKEKRK